MPVLSVRLKDIYPATALASTVALPTSALFDCSQSRGFSVVGWRHYEVEDVSTVRAVPKPHWQGVELILPVDTHDYVPEAFGFGLLNVGGISQELVIRAYGAGNLFRPGKSRRHLNRLRLNEFFHFSAQLSPCRCIYAPRATHSTLIRWLRRRQCTQTPKFVKSHFSFDWDFNFPRNFQVLLDKGTVSPRTAADV